MLWCCLYEYYLLFFFIFFSQFPLQKLVLTNGLVWVAKPLLAPCSTSAFRRLTLHTALQSTKYLWFAQCSPYMHNVHHICTMFTKCAKCWPYMHNCVCKIVNTQIFLDSSWTHPWYFVYSVSVLYISKFSRNQRSAAATFRVSNFTFLSQFNFLLASQ